jgi:hypothetical protein
MDDKKLKSILTNYQQRDRQLDQVWYNVISVKDAGRQDLLTQQLLLFNRVAMIYNVTVNRLMMMQQVGVVDSDMKLEYQPFLNNKAEPAENLPYIPAEDERGIQERLDSVLAKPLVIKVK